MTFKINEQLTGALFIAGKEFPLDYGNALKTLHIKASSLITLPELKLTFVDGLNQMPYFALQDGAQITVQINGGDLQLTRPFRVHKWKRVPAAQGFIYSLECYFDAPRYWLGTSKAGMRGSSAQVLQQIAQTCGLAWSPGNATTADSMLWMQGNRTFGKFARDIARAGYVSDTSHMVLAVDSLGKMRYRDINANPKPKVTVGYQRPPDATVFQQITDFTPVTNSGTLNAVGGYLHSRYTQPISGTATEDSSLSDELQFTPDAQYPLLSNDVRAAMVNGSVSFGAVDFGNVHHKYERARYQNTRYNLLNSMSAEFLFPFQTAWEPFDNYNMAPPSELNSTQYSGEYTIQTKIIFIQGGTYNEQMIAVKNGLNK